MYKNKKVAVSIPAYNEERFLEKVINKVPDYVDSIVVTNDASTDNTKQLLEKIALHNPRVHVINSEVNECVGAAILKAHKVALELGSDLLVVVGGDDQMDTTFIPQLLDPVVNNEADYTKGTRLASLKSANGMPYPRYIGNMLFTWICRIITGDKNTQDPLNGFTAISADTFKKLDLTKVGRGFDFEITMLLEMLRLRKRIKSIPMPSIYSDEISDINLVKDSIKIMWQIIKWRLVNTTLAEIFFVAVMFVGMTLIVLVPPFQSPDEDTHYLRAAALSQRYIKCPAGKLPVMGKYVSLVNYMGINVIKHSPRNKFDPKLLTSFSLTKGAYDTTTLYIPNILCYQLPIGHILPAVAIGLANLTGFNPLVGFYLARICVLLVGAVLVAFAIKTATHGKRILVACALLPMTINQLMTIGYDSLIIALSFLFYAFLLSPQVIQKYKAMLLITIVATLKIAYLPLAFLFFITKLPVKTRAALTIVSLVIPALILFTQNEYLGSQKYIADLPTDTATQTAHLLENPLRLIIYTLRTVKQSHPFLYMSTLGILGWLDVVFPPEFYFGISLLLIMYLTEHNDIELTLYQNIISMGVVLGSLLLVFASLYLIFTPKLLPAVVGVQGRYFIPILPVFIASVAPVLSKVRIKVRSKVLKYVYISGGVLLYFVLVKTIIERYYTL